MFTLRDFETMIHSTEQHSTTIVSNLNAYLPLSQLANPDRMSFTQFCYENGKKSPLPAIIQYLETYNASSTGLQMGMQIERVLLKNMLNRNYKSALFGAIGQAYLDLCLAVSVADFSTESTTTCQYNQYISLVESSVEFAFDSCSKFMPLIEMMGDYQGDLKSVFDMVKNSDKSKSDIIDRITDACNILSLWNEDKIKYDSQYEDIQKSVREISDRKDKQISELKAKVEFSDLILDAYTQEDFDLSVPSCKKIQDRLIELKEQYGFDVHQAKQELGL